MGFHDKLQRIINKKKPRTFKRSCDNFWCKVRYEVNEFDFEDYPEFYKVCPKCRSFDKELSGGVENNGTVEFEGDRFDNSEQEILLKEYKGDFFKK